MVMVAIFHEGRAQKSEDNWLLKKLIDTENLDEQHFQFFGIGGKSNFFKSQTKEYIELLLMVDAGQITRILFVIDADHERNDNVYGEYSNTLAEWHKVVNQLGVGAISDIYITCDPRTQEGYVESLLLSTLDEEKVACIKSFLDCSDFKSKENHKAILNQIYKIAYPNAPFDLKHPHFDELKTKLRELVA